MNDIEITDVSLRISEYNLRANAYFKKSIMMFDEAQKKELVIERERLLTYVKMKFPTIPIQKYLREVKKYNEDGSLVPDMSNDLQGLMKALKEAVQNNKQVETKG